MRHTAPMLWSHITPGNHYFISIVIWLNYSSEQLLGKISCGSIRSVKMSAYLRKIFRKHCKIRAGLCRPSCRVYVPHQSSHCGLNRGQYPSRFGGGGASVDRQTRTAGRHDGPGGSWRHLGASWRPPVRSWRPRGDPAWHTTVAGSV